MKRGKTYRAALAKIDRTRAYPLAEAVELVRQVSAAKFDETIEVSMNLNLKKSQTVRDTLVLPHQFKAGKRILVFAKGEPAERARQAGAAYVGDDDLIQKIKDGWLDFDVAVATPDMMKDVGRLGPILGRRGLMPNPKTQTVTMDVAGAVAELNKGRIEFRADKTGVIHLAAGKVSMEADKVVENVRTVVDEVKKRRPAEAKGEFVKSVTIAATMSPGVRVQVEE